GIERHRATIVGALVIGRLSFYAEVAPVAGAKADRLGRAEDDAAARFFVAAQAAGVQPVTFHSDTTRRPVSFGDPSPWAIFIKRLWCNAFLHPDAKHGLCHDSRVNAF